jgi:hypothetical protein
MDGQISRESGAPARRGAALRLRIIASAAPEIAFAAPLKQLPKQKNFSLQLNAMVRCARKAATQLV